MSQAPFTLQGHNPDVLTCIANLSNDEVFTPPEFANQMLDTLAQSWASSNNGENIWSNKKVTFLDPSTKSGVFLREIVKRMNEGLAQEIPDLTERINHILTKQVFGIGITELTSLLARRSVYCSKYANGIHSIARTFINDNGNIWFERTEHLWSNGKCAFCGANESEYQRSSELETHAYAFIHDYEIEHQLSQMFGGIMHFDVIIGNPPYQLDTGGSGRQAKPIYQHFVNQAIKLEPRFLCMVIPARWYSGGFGLDTFRNDMLTDKRIRNLVDFENAADVFPGVDIAGGICYFLLDNSYDGDCEVTSITKDSKVTVTRSLDEFEIFVRQSRAIPIIRKIQKHHATNGKFLNEVVSSIRPFGLPTNYLPNSSGIPCRFIQKIGLKYADPNDVTDSNEFLMKWKLLIPKAPIAGQTDFSKPVRFYHDKNAVVARPGECCTESWIVACAFDTEKEVLSFRSYLFTKTVRFLILQTAISQDVNRKNFRFVPDFGTYSGEYTDDLLRSLWNIDEEEWAYIDSRILPANS
jgi:site-specific DNA-methyltransferase (adenine-specific)